MPPSARVVVSTYNRPAVLRLALRGYLRQTTRDFTLVVADDGSGPETGDVVSDFAREARARGIDVEHVWIPDEGFRKTTVLNEAVRLGRGEPLLVFTDGDCLPPARFVEVHLGVHTPRSLHVGGAWRLSETVSASLTATDVDAGRFEDLKTPEQRRDLAIRRRKSRWGTLLRRPNRPKILGLNFALDLALLEAINGFDEAFATWGIGEDDDVRDRVLRLRPRPSVKNLYLVNDVFHLWHPPAPGGRARSMTYYRTNRPVRCRRGLVRE
jgi:glycosyltransferase involved in cell wall biosynthesis